MEGTRSMPLPPSSPASAPADTTLVRALNHVPPPSRGFATAPSEPPATVLATVSPTSDTPAPHPPATNGVVLAHPPPCSSILPCPTTAARATSFACPASPPPRNRRLLKDLQRRRGKPPPPHGTSGRRRRLASTQSPHPQRTDRRCYFDPFTGDENHQVRPPLGLPFLLWETMRADDSLLWALCLSQSCAGEAEDKLAAAGATNVDLSMLLVRDSSSCTTPPPLRVLLEAGVDGALIVQPINHISLCRTSVLKKYPSKFIGCCLANLVDDGTMIKQLLTQVASWNFLLTQKE